MTEQATHDMSEANQERIVFQIQRVYLKDMSLEQPNSPAIFLRPEALSIEVSVDVGTESLQTGMFESVLIMTVTAKMKDKIAYLVEAKQAGIFEIRHIPAEQFEPVLGITCPAIIYPYLRANIADMVTRAGFAPIHLDEIDFHLLYQKRQQAVAEQQAKNISVAGTDTVN